MPRPLSAALFGAAAGAGLVLAATSVLGNRPSPAPAAGGPASSPASPASDRQPLAPSPCAADLARAQEGLAELRQQLAAQEQELRAAEAAVDALQIEAWGRPTPWPEDPPAHLSPEGFRAAVETAAERCNTAMTLVDIDCTEAPCLAVVRPESDNWWNEFINECPHWTEPYGSAVSMLARQVDCGEGDAERMIMFAPSEAADWLTALDPTVEDHLSKRLDYRAASQHSAWTCRGDAP